MKMYHMLIIAFIFAVIIIGLAYYMERQSFQLYESSKHTYTVEYGEDYLEWHLRVYGHYPIFPIWTLM